MLDTFQKSDRKTLLAASLLLAVVVLRAQSPGAPLHQWFVKEGIRVDFTLEHIDPSLPPGTFLEGDNVRFTFEITDTATHRPLSGAYPAAWMDIDESENAFSEESCKGKIQNFLTGGIFGRAELDLNVYYVVALNEDPTLSVVDPLFSYGGSKLLALVQLHSPGKDWALSRDKRYLFVSTPNSREVAVVNTITWTVAQFLPFQSRPDRMVLQPDGHYLWVAYQDGPEGLAQNSGVAVINTESLKVEALIPTGAGAHDIAITDDDRLVFVSNYKDQTVSVIDIGTLQKTATIPTAEGPGFMAWSPASQSVYVTHQIDGSITCIDGKKLQTANRIPAAPGVNRIRFAPNGRLGFIVNPQQNFLYILDAATNKIIQRGEVEAVPDQVTFTDELAYIRHRGSENVLMVPLAAVGTEGNPIPVIDFPGGDNPPGQTPYPVLADGIVQAPGASAVVVSNPMDQAIYFYKEGMAAPMGAFNNYGHQPMAVTVVDRSLKETSPGRYQTVAKLRRPGGYCLAFFMNSPQLGHCFEVEVGGKGNIELERAIAEQGPLKITPIFSERTAKVHKDFTVRFALHPHDQPVPITGLGDVQLLYLTNSGQWSKRESLLENTKVAGVYEATIQFPHSGVYFLYVSCVSQGLIFNNPQYILIQAVEDSSD